MVILNYNDTGERIFKKCRKTKTKIITKANQNKGKCQREPIRTQNPEARENAGDRVTYGFSFESNWPKKWREFYEPITERNKSKPKQTRITFDSHLKMTPNAKLNE